MKKRSRRQRRAENKRRQQDARRAREPSPGLVTPIAAEPKPIQESAFAVVPSAEHPYALQSVIDAATAGVVLLVPLFAVWLKAGELLRGSPLNAIASLQSHWQSPVAIVATYVFLLWDYRAARKVNVMIGNKPEGAVRWLYDMVVLFLFGAAAFAAGGSSIWLPTIYAAIYFFSLMWGLYIAVHTDNHPATLRCLRHTATDGFGFVMLLITAILTSPRHPVGGELSSRMLLWTVGELGAVGILDQVLQRIPRAWVRACGRVLLRILSNVTEPLLALAHRVQAQLGIPQPIGEDSGRGAP